MCPTCCANGLQDGFEVIFQGRSRQLAREWGDLVRAASTHAGPWPKVSVWHGDADSTVKPMNAGEIIKQWTDVHGLDGRSPLVSTVDGQQRRLWRNADGEVLVESFTIAGMAHGIAIDPTVQGWLRCHRPLHPRRRHLLDPPHRRVLGADREAMGTPGDDGRGGADDGKKARRVRQSVAPAEEKIRVRVRAGSAPLPVSTIVPIEKVERLRRVTDAPFNKGLAVELGADKGTYKRSGRKKSRTKVKFKRMRAKSGRRRRPQELAPKITPAPSPASMAPGIINASLQAAGLLKGGDARARPVLPSGVSCAPSTSRRSSPGHSKWPA